jgi:predicted dithiol-disulfide oxidoreductase (DUF899 family)
MKKSAAVKKPANKNRSSESCAKEHQQIVDQINELRTRLTEVNREWAMVSAAQKGVNAEVPPHNGIHGWHEVKDFKLFAPNGKKIHLSDLFGKHDELIVIQNMGKGCPYCTLWADGFNGWTDHLENRAGFALVSSNKPAELKKFAKSRGWNFKTYSSHGSDFKKYLGFEDAKGNPNPGVSSFYREKGRIYNIANDTFGPGDPYCGFWPLTDLLKDGIGDWRPKYKYKK